MNIGSLKTRIKKLEPKQKIERCFGELSENDPRTFPPGMGLYRVYGYEGNMCMCFGGGYFHTYTEGMDLLKKELRKYTYELCDIIHTDNNGDKMILKTIYSFDGKNIIDKYPQGINEALHTNYDIKAGMTNKEWLALFHSL